MRRSLGWCIAALAAITFATPPVRADFTFGYTSRYTAMGGAGLAVIDNPSQAAQLNPAALSLRPFRLEVQWPDFSFRANGAGLSDAVTRLATSTLSGSDAQDLARDFGKDSTRLDAGLSFGAAASIFDLRANSDASVRVEPGSGFRRWAASGQDFGAWISNQSDLTASLAGATNAAALQQQLDAQGFRADVLGVAQIAPSFGVGMRLPSRMLGQQNLGDLRLGVRMKPVRSYYSHWVVKADASQVTDADFTAQGFQGYDKLRIQTARASELGAANSFSETSLAADLGVLWQPAQLPYATFALTVENLIEPGFTVPDAVGVPHAGDKLLPRTLNLGAAIQAPNSITLAADLVDVTGARGSMQLRAGAEIRPPLPGLRWMALRAGYNSGTGLTAGVGIGSFGLAFATRTPVLVNQTLNF